MYSDYKDSKWYDRRDLSALEQRQYRIARDMYLGGWRAADRDRFAKTVPLIEKGVELEDVVSALEFIEARAKNHVLYDNYENACQPVEVKKSGIKDRIVLTIYLFDYTSEPIGEITHTFTRENAIDMAEAILDWAELPEAERA